VNFLFDHDVPDDLSYVLKHMGHDVVLLRDALSMSAADAEVLRYATERGQLLVTCNRDDFIALAPTQPHHGIIVLFRRKSRTAERTALLRLLATAGEQGLARNITFA
jgi:predicted nuclease of predicted toxin-antitoxin system